MLENYSTLKQQQNLFGFLLIGSSPEIVNKNEFSIHELDPISTISIFLLKKKFLISSVALVKFKNEVNEEYQTIGVIDNEKRSIKFEFKDSQ
jgi:hypothetical protein